MKGKAVEICPSCEGYVLDAGGDKVYKDLDLDGDYLVGNWFYTSETSTSEGTYNELYVTVEKNSTVAPKQYTLTAYLRKYTTGVLEAYDGTAMNFDVSDIAGTGSAADPATLTLAGAIDTGSKENLTLTAFGSADTTNAGKVKVTLNTSLSAGGVLNKQDHAEHVFAVMTDADPNKAAYYRYEGNHYLECTVDGCGLDFVAEEHNVGCKDCGWSEDLVPVAFCKAGGTAMFTIYAPTTFSVTLPSSCKVKDAFGKEYTLTDGYCYTATDVTNITNWGNATAITGSAGVYKVFEYR